MSLRIIAIAIVLSTPIALAGDRTVINGDILHSASAEASDSATARFLATQSAIKALMVECSIAHRGIKVWDSGVSKEGYYYSARATAGLSFEDCEEGKRAKDKSKLENPELIKQQALYEDYLKKQLGLTKQPTVIIKDNKDLKAISEKLDRINEKLDRPQQAQKEVVTIREVASPVASPMAATPKAACLAQANAIMRQAYSVSDRYGNMATGQAREFMNQADSMRASCN